MRKCSKCERELPLDNYKPAKRCIGGRMPICLDCLHQKERFYRLLHVYKITERDYDEMLQAQGGVCGLCKKPETRTWKDGTIKPLAVDHDHTCCPDRRHTCGKCVRGLLCEECNHNLGRAEKLFYMLLPQI